MDKGKRICESCEETVRNDPETQVCKKNTLGVKILATATFKCFFKCKTVLNSLQELEKHVLTECGLVPILCSQECGERIIRQQMPDHIQHDCG